MKNPGRPAYPLKQERISNQKNKNARRNRICKTMLEKDRYNLVEKRQKGVTLIDFKSNYILDKKVLTLMKNLISKNSKESLLRNLVKTYLTKIITSTKAREEFKILMIKIRNMIIN